MLSFHNRAVAFFAGGSRQGGIDHMDPMVHRIPVQEALIDGIALQSVVQGGTKRMGRQPIPSRGIGDGPASPQAGLPEGTLGAKPLEVPLSEVPNALEML